MELITDFQKIIEPTKFYSAQELRRIILNLFPLGKQSSRKGYEPIMEVKFQGLLFINNSVPGSLSLNFDKIYARTQFSEGTREEILERLILDRQEGFGCWVEIIEMLEKPNNMGKIKTMFDYNSVGFSTGYRLRDR